MRTCFLVGFISALVLVGVTSAGAANVSFRIGTGDYYMSVGDYDYLPYAYQNNPGYNPPRINFTKMMSQYGRWVKVSPFGQVWRPYASAGWRPYTYGHWIYTDSGPYWEGYEPWAWAGYHYGSWIFDRRYGWVWVPGYDWHPGRVQWARGYDTIGWMPRPPDGYDYQRGSLMHVGDYNQFTYSDGDFEVDFGSGSYSYGGPYYDPRARDMYYNPAYAAIDVNLWVFIDNSNFERDNYADYELGSDYTRYAFDQKMVRVSNRPIDRSVMERIIQQPIQQAQVDSRNLKTDKGRTIRVVVPSGNSPVERIHRQSPEVVKQVIAPGFAQEKRQFKGSSSKIQAPVAKIFQQENVKPRYETPTRQQVINSANEAQKTRDQKKVQNTEAVKQRTETLKKEGKIAEPGKAGMPGKDVGSDTQKQGKSEPAKSAPDTQKPGKSGESKGRGPDSKTGRSGH